MSDLPTVVLRAFEQYVSRTKSTDVADRYKSLEAAWSATIKYAGTAAVAAAEVYYPRRRQEVADRILGSSSLGGWVDAVSVLCRCSGDLPPRARAYTKLLNTYKKHPDRAALDELSSILSTALEPLRQRGYRIESDKSPSLLRIFEKVVTIRNKHAHGYLSPQVLHRVEGPLFKALKRTLRLVPFSSITLKAPYGPISCEFVGLWPQKTPQPPRFDELWSEGDLLEAQAVRTSPFAVYHSDSEKVYFLNSAIDESGRGEYIDHETGAVRYWEVAESWTNGAQPRRRSRRPDAAEIAEARCRLRDVAPLQWEEVPLSTEALQQVKDRAGVYCFRSEAAPEWTGLGAPILYVGSTSKDMGSRLREYLRYRQGYDASRREIAQMFRAYEDLRLWFAQTGATEAIKLEQAIWASSQPAYNLVAPRARRSLGD